MKNKILMCLITSSVILNTGCSNISNIMDNGSSSSVVENTSVNDSYINDNKPEEVSKIENEKQLTREEVYKNTLSELSVLSAVNISEASSNLSFSSFAYKTFVDIMLSNNNLSYDEAKSSSNTILSKIPDEGTYLTFEDATYIARNCKYGLNDTKNNVNFGEFEFIVDDSMTSNDKKKLLENGLFNIKYFPLEVKLGDKEFSKDIQSKLINNVSSIYSNSDFTRYSINYGKDFYAITSEECSNNSNNPSFKYKQSIKINVYKFLYNGILNITYSNYILNKDGKDLLNVRQALLYSAEDILSLYGLKNVVPYIK